MNRYLITIILSVGFLSSVFLYTSAQELPVLTATLHSLTPEAKDILAGAQYVDVARITLTASVYDVMLDGIYLTTDVSGGLSNFTNIYVYDTTDYSLVDTYPDQSENLNFISLGGNVRIGNGGTPKTYLLRASLAPSATGNIRLGFSGFTFPTLTTPTLVGVPIYGNVMTLPGTMVTPTPASTSSPQASPTPTPTLTPTTTPTTTPQPTPVPPLINTPTSLGFTSLSALGLSEGNTVSAANSDDPDIYIVNDWGYKRLFLNPAIFNFYSHLGGFAKVKNITSSTSVVLVTSSFFRNCETNDSKVYGLETTGEDVGVLHWVNTSGAQAMADNPDFFKKVFCINTNEFNWYSKGSNYTSINQVPNYSR
ncbi:MAG: hypothetical protein Q8P69_01535 [bacterium]|nr:hypothetical protein [bacterium]